MLNEGVWSYRSLVNRGSRKTKTGHDEWSYRRRRRGRPLQPGHPPSASHRAGPAPGGGPRTAHPVRGPALAQARRGRRGAGHHLAGDPPLGDPQGLANERAQAPRRCRAGGIRRSRTSRQNQGQAADRRIPLRAAIVFPPDLVVSENFARSTDSFFSSGVVRLYKDAASSCLAQAVTDAFESQTHH